MYGAMPKTSEKPMSQCPPGFASDKMDYKQYSRDDQNNHGWGYGLKKVEKPWTRRRELKH